MRLCINVCMTPATAAEAPVLQARVWGGRGPIFWAALQWRPESAEPSPDIPSKQRECWPPGQTSDIGQFVRHYTEQRSDYGDREKRQNTHQVSQMTLWRYKECSKCQNTDDSYVNVRYWSLLIVLCLLSRLMSLHLMLMRCSDNEWQSRPRIHYRDDTPVFRCHHPIVITRHSQSYLGADTGNCVVTISWKQFLSHVLSPLW